MPHPLPRGEQHQSSSQQESAQGYLLKMRGKVPPSHPRIPVGGVGEFFTHRHSKELQGYTNNSFFQMTPAWLRRKKTIPGNRTCWAGHKPERGSESNSALEPTRARQYYPMICKQGSPRVGEGRLTSTVRRTSTHSHLNKQPTSLLISCWSKYS